jgi:E3 ubiquitin-protein ligase BOI-like protein
MNLSSGSKWFIYCFFSSIKLFVKSKPIQKPNNFVGVNILIKFIPFFLCQQNERLRLVLQEQRKQDLAVLLSNVESKTTSLIRRKEEDLAQATMRTMELQECLKKAEMESETWQRIARANEAMVTDLNNTLEQVRERLVLVSNTAEDAASFCGSCDQQEAVKRSSRKITCKRCYSRSSCVLFLPCRHLCSCKNCEAFLGSCPVCNAVKEGSIEVFLV